MNAPEFLTVGDVLELHEDVLAADGGAEGLRDRGLLDSAVHAPQASFGGTFLLGDIFEMAAAYLFHRLATTPSSMATSAPPCWQPSCFSG